LQFPPLEIFFPFFLGNIGKSTPYRIGKTEKGPFFTKRLVNFSDIYFLFLLLVVKEPYDKDTLTQRRNLGGLLSYRVAEIFQNNEIFLRKLRQTIFTAPKYET